MRRDYGVVFETAQGRILGVLLDAVSCALRRVKKVKLDRLPRMADFAEWATAAEPALGWEQGTFMLAYDAKSRLCEYAGPRFLTTRASIEKATFA